MSQQHFSEPPSILSRRKEGDGPKKQTREEYRQQKELEELRKAGTAPAEVDESGRDINPHIPKYMVDVPWYVTYDHSKPTLKHQRKDIEKEKVYDGMDKWYNRGAVGKLATKFREGSCENCGGIGHKKKDCLERPRKVLAKYSNEVLTVDEEAQPDLSLTFDGKRDRWNGVDLDWYQNKIKNDFEKLAEAKRLLKAKKLQESIVEVTVAPQPGLEVAEEVDQKHDSDADEDEDEDKYADEADMPGQKINIESKQRISVRNLRMREDTAKYLLNLDPNSAYYDPKSRSMRDNPFAGTSKDPSSVPYIGDNYVRYSGEANRFAKSQMFAWDASEKGVEIHQQADPTKLELLHQEFKQRHEEYAKNVKTSVLEKYGGAEYLEAPPKELIYAQTENYIEYNRYGNIVKTQEKATPKSKYVEDQLANNHKYIWGSYWKDGKWGYKCCESINRDSYCEGSLVNIINVNVNYKRKLGSEDD
jgi:pre-mRNA-processing factor SLU7